MNPPSTPASLGYRMPAEWEPHAGTWFSWPRPEGISFPGKNDKEPPLVEEYTYSEIKANPGLTDKDFDPANPTYAFPK